MFDHEESFLFKCIVWPILGICFVVVLWAFYYGMTAPPWYGCG